VRRKSFTGEVWKSLVDWYQMTVIRSNGRLPEDDKHERCEENRPLINRKCVGELVFMVASCLLRNLWARQRREKLSSCRRTQHMRVRNRLWNRQQEINRHAIPGLWWDYPSVKPFTRSKHSSCNVETLTMERFSRRWPEHWVSRTWQPPFVDRNMMAAAAVG
jgi:hypothetical protein